MEWNAVMISIQYGVTKALARKLADQAKVIETKSSTELKADGAEIQTFWRGDNSVLYIRKLDYLEQKMTKNAQGLKESARVIEELADNLYKAELQAIEIAKNREH